MLPVSLTQKVSLFQWVPVGLSGVVATWDMEGVGEDDDDADEDSHPLAEAVLLKAGLEHDDEDELQVQGEEEEAGAAEALEASPAQAEAAEAAESHSAELVFFKGQLTDQLTGLPLALCADGFAMTRSLPAEVSAQRQFIADPKAAEPEEWDAAEDGEWAPPVIPSPDSQARVIQSILAPGEGWEGSYECVGNPTRAKLNVLEPSDSRLSELSEGIKYALTRRESTPKMRMVVNMSFDTVTQTGGFALRAAPSGPLRVAVRGQGTRLNARSDYTASVEALEEERGEEQEQGAVEQAEQPSPAQPRRKALRRLVLQPHASVVAAGGGRSGDFMPFRLNATEKRAAALLSSVEQVRFSSILVRF